METIYKKIITYNNIQEIMNNNPTEEEINNAMSILVKKGIETGAIKIENTASREKDYILILKEDYDDWD